MPGEPVSPTSPSAPGPIGRPTWGDPYWGGCFYWDGCYHYWDGTCYYPYGSRFGRYRGRHHYDAYYPEPVAAAPRENRTLLVFFPPEPPPLGAPLPSARPRAGEEVVAPKELVNYLTAPFYAPLSTRLARRNLSDKLLERLENYRSSQAALLEELRAKINATKELALAPRTEALEAFARVQAPRLAALENEAEWLRTGLRRTGLVGALNGTGDWNENRKWRLGERMEELPRERVLTLEFRVIRAAAFYQEGLLPAQRRLLLELATDLQVEAYLPQSMRALEDERAPLFFSPETARIRFSEDVPEQIAARLASYKKEKDALKEELRELLVAQDDKREKNRVAALEQLAEAHRPRLAALEWLAEEIRGELAVWNRPVRPQPLPELPAALASRVAAYRAEKAALQAALDARLAELRKNAVANEAEAVAQQTTRKELLAEFRRAHEARFAEIEATRKSLAAELVAFLSEHGRRTTSNSVDALIAMYEQSKATEGAWALYDDYATAVFLPGLSPEQRRLLFAAAVQKLGLPLPDGEYLP